MIFEKLRFLDEEPTIFKLSLRLKFEECDQVKVEELMSILKKVMNLPILRTFTRIDYYSFWLFIIQDAE